MVSKILHGRFSRLRLFDKVDDMCKARILADLLDLNDETSGLDNRAGINRCARVLHRWI